MTYQVQTMLRPQLLKFDDGAKQALVLLGQTKRQLGAFRHDGIEGITPARVRVYGFASVFKTGARVWDTTVTFLETTPGVFRYDDLWTNFQPPGQGFPPRIIGFIEDYPRAERGTPQGRG